MMNHAPTNSDGQPSTSGSLPTAQTSESPPRTSTAVDTIPTYTGFTYPTSTREHTPNTNLAPWRPNRQLWLIILGQTAVVFVVSLDSTILTVALPTLASALNANTIKAFWIIAAYLLACAVVQPLMAAFADIFGRRGTFFTSLLLFTVGTAVCCAAHSVPQMLAGRVIQGLGGGGILTVNLIILSDIIPLRYRSKYVGIVQLVNSLATNLGPIVGGGLIKVDWRWLFYVNFPFCAVGLAAIPFLLRYVKAQTTVYQRVSQVDWIGSGIFVVGATAFLVAVSWGGNLFAWASTATLVPLIGGIAVVCFGVLYECYGTTSPFLRLSLFETSSAVSVYICTLLASTYFINLYLLTVKLYSPVLSGTIFLAYSFAVVPVSGITGQFITRFGSYKWAIFCGWLTNTLGLGSFMILQADSYLPGVIFTLMVAGVGQGLLFMAHQVAAQASCKAKDVGYASAMFSFTRSLGLCLGIALGGTIFQNFLKQRLADLGLPGAIAANAEAYASVLRAMPGGEQKDAIIDAYAWAFRNLWAAMTGISGLGFVLSFLIGEHTLDIELDSTHKLISRELLQEVAEKSEEKNPSELAFARRPSLAC